MGISTMIQQITQKLYKKVMRDRKTRGSKHTGLYFQDHGKYYHCDTPEAAGAKEIMDFKVQRKREEKEQSTLF